MSLSEVQDLINSILFLTKTSNGFFSVALVHYFFNDYHENILDTKTMKTDLIRKDYGRLSNSKKCKNVKK